MSWNELKSEAGLEVARQKGRFARWWGGRSEAELALIVGLILLLAGFALGLSVR